MKFDIHPSLTTLIDKILGFDDLIHDYNKKKKKKKT